MMATPTTLPSSSSSCGNSDGKKSCSSRTTTNNATKSCCAGNASDVSPSCCAASATTMASTSCASKNGTSHNMKSCCNQQTHTNIHEVEEEENNNDNDDNLCLAVVRENGADVVVFDKEGKPRVFSIHDNDGTQINKNNNDPNKKICFSTHGQEGIDDLLTPCFDEDGKHGIPEEGCFCGIDTPHLHAHLYNPTTCDDHNENEEVLDLVGLGGEATSFNSSQTNTKKNKKTSTTQADDIMFLSQLTLHPNDNDHDDNNDALYEISGHTNASSENFEENERIPFLAISERLPKECNSKEIKRQQSYHQQEQQKGSSSCSDCCTNPASTTHTPSTHHGHDQNHYLHGQTHVRRRKNGTNGHGYKNSRRMHKVQHDDHVDYLVHNTKTDKLHLEHPCDGCGDDDVHGNFNLVTKRRLLGNALQVHFFEVSSKPFHILDYFKNLPSPPSFNLHSDRVLVTRNTVTSHDYHPHDHQDSGGHGHDTHHGPCCGATTTTTTLTSPPIAAVNKKSKISSTSKTSPKGTTVRSQYLCTKICCSSEIPMIHNALDPIDGIQNILINVPLKTVYVDHNPSTVSANDIEFELNRNNFGAKIKNDGGKAVASTAGIFGAGSRSAPLSSPPLSTTTTNNNNNPNEEGRSAFFVEKICCASEIPAILQIVEPLDGVSNVRINVTTKMVYVNHNIGKSTAHDIRDALNNQSFGAHLKHDGASDCQNDGTSGGFAAFVKSTLGYHNKSHHHHVHQQQDSTSEIQNFLETHYGSESSDSVLEKDDYGNETGGDDDAAASSSWLESPFFRKMESYEIDSTNGIIHIVHNPHFLTVQQVRDDLIKASGREGSAIASSITILSDGVDTMNWVVPDMKEEVAPEEMTSGPNPFVVLSGIFWVVSMLSFIGGNWKYLQYVGLLSVVFGLPSISIKALNTLQRYQFDANCMMLFATLGSLGLQEFTEAAAITFLFSISEYLEVQATSRARKALSDIVHLRPEHANLIHPITQEILAVPATCVPVGAFVSVRFGDKIPCDGIVIEGNSSVDESTLTGESRPVKKGPNDKVSGGTINTGDTPLKVCTTSTVENSAVARLIRLVEEAQANRSPTEKLVDEFARRYTPVVLLAALCMVTIPWAFGVDTGRRWTHNGLVLIIVACPCALIISTPVSYVAGLAATAQRGIIIKGGAHLEALGLVKKIAFDKTGTLTAGDFALLHLNVMGTAYTRQQVLQYLSKIEGNAAHPLSQALVQAARNEKVKVPRDMTMVDHKHLEGEGITAIVNDQRVHVGNERLFRRLGLFAKLLPQDQKIVEEWAALGGTIGYMSIGGEGIVCAYCVADAIRPESADVVSQLQTTLGIECCMLTGDRKEAALKIAAQVGLAETDVHSQLLPEDKLNLVVGMKNEDAQTRAGLFNPFSKRQLILFLGDGVNDAPAMASADIGVAMGAGAALAMETSDVTLLDSHLSKLIYSIEMGRRVIYKIKENVIFSLVAKAIVVGFALVGKVDLWAAIASDVGAMLIVTLNGMRLLPTRKDKTNLAVASNTTSTHKASATNV